VFGRTVEAWVVVEKKEGAVERNEKISMVVVLVLRIEKSTSAQGVVAKVEEAAEGPEVAKQVSLLMTCFRCVYSDWLGSLALTLPACRGFQKGKPGVIHKAGPEIPASSCAPSRQGSHG